MTTQKRLVSAMLLCAVGVAIAGLQCGLTVRQYTVQTDKIGNGKHLRAKPRFLSAICWR